jgi:hypothetical protein
MYDQNLLTLPNINFRENPFSGTQVVSCCTERWADETVTLSAPQGCE